MSQQGINISKYVHCVGQKLGETGKIQDAIVDCAFDLAAELQSSLKQKEKLALVETGQPPHLIIDAKRGTISPEILAWSIAVTASAWSEWVFAAKSNNPINQEDKTKPEAAINIKLVWPYVRTSIEDALSKARQIGLDKEKKHIPHPRDHPIYIELRK